VIHTFVGILINVSQTHVILNDMKDPGFINISRL